MGLSMSSKFKPLAPVTTEEINKRSQRRFIRNYTGAEQVIAKEPRHRPLAIKFGQPVYLPKKGQQRPQAPCGDSPEIRYRTKQV